MKTAEEYLYKWMNDSDIDVPTIIEEIISDAYEDIEKEKEISNWIAKYLTLEESQLQPLPDEWWAKLKEGDKFNGDGRTWTFHELLVTTEEGKVFDLNEISPYTAPTAAEARAKLSDEEYEVLKKQWQQEMHKNDLSEELADQSEAEAKYKGGREMNWTQPKPPTQGVSNYDHVVCETPLGQAIIEWKGWKKSDSYSLTIGNDYVGEGLNLYDAKRLAKEWLTKKYNELAVLLEL